MQENRARSLFKKKEVIPTQVETVIVGNGESGRQRVPQTLVEMQTNRYIEDKYNRNVINSSLVVTSPVDFKRDILGITDPTVTIEIMQYKSLSVEAIVIPDVVDKHGKLSNMIAQYEDAYDLSVVPLSITTILPQVTKLQRHDIVEFNGERYAVSTDRIVNAERFLQYEKKIVEQLSEGCAFIDSLWETRDIQGYSVQTVKFNTHELETLCGRFRNYSPRVIMTSQGEYKFIVGGIIDRRK